MAATVTEDHRPFVLTVPEVAQELRASEWTVRELVRSGAIAHVRVGRLIRITRQQLDDFLGLGR